MCWSVRRIARSDKYVHTHTEQHGLARLCHVNNHQLCQHHPTQSYAFKACRPMFSIIGAAGLWSIQHWGHRGELQEAAKAAVKSALKVGNRNPRLSSSSDRHSASVDSSKSSHQQHQWRSCNVRDGAFVCFKDRTGQVAVIQPYGNGGSWQLTVTCASGGCCLLPEGKGPCKCPQLPTRTLSADSTSTDSTACLCTACCTPCNTLLLPA